MNIINIDNLHVKIDNHVVLQDISFSIEDKGNVIGLFGPNGAGKTTLINVLTGSINKYNGVVIKPPMNKIAYLPDKPFIYDFMTINQIIALFQDVYHDVDIHKAKSLFNSLGLNLDQKISTCSKGMSEQIHIILTISRNAKLYIMDEPLAGIDPLTRDSIIDIIKNYRYTGSTVLVSTHLINDVQSLFDEVVMIQNGKVLLHNKTDILMSSSNDSLENIIKEELRRCS